MTLDGRPLRSDGSLESDRLSGFDFSGHNDQVREVWSAFRQHRPTRVPIFFGTNTRYFMFNAGANRDGLGFERYSEDPDVMFDALLRFARWSRFNLLQDAELGLPEKWSITPDFQNYYEAAWLGCGVEYMNNQVPDTRPAYCDRPEDLLDKGPPDPFGRLMARGREFYEHFRDRARGQEFLDRPIEITPPGFAGGTDGVLTVACNVFGAETVCAAMLEEPERFDHWLRFLIEATIDRVRSWKRYLSLPERVKDYGFADDSVALISTSDYRKHVLPHHRRLCDALAGEGPRSIHLCGDASRHFRLLRDELDIRSFDTGFPIDFAQVRREVGPDVTIQGGPHVELLLHGSVAEVRDEVRRILSSGVLEGGRFVLREGNNLAPGTPLDNTDAMYHAGVELGRFAPEGAR